LVGTGATWSGAFQGSSVSISADGNTAIVGGYGDNSNAGAAWIFTRSGGVWTQQGSKLVGTGATENANQGYSVSISADGNTAIVGGDWDGSTGAAWIYSRSGGVWTQQGSKLVGTGAAGNAGQGHSVSISADGNTAIVGGYGDNSLAGAAWIYTRSGGVWTQQGSKLVGTGAVGNARQGFSVSISADGNTAIVGGYRDNSSTGAAWVFIPPATPTITSFTPTSAGAGTQITITGTNLTGTSAITLGGTSVASFTVVSATTISAVVGTGSTGALSLVTPGGTTTLSGFTFISAPTITSFTPTSAGSGATITIIGTNFNSTSAITLGGTSVASFTVLSSTTISAVVGTGSTGALSLVTPGGTATLAGFTFIAAPTITSFTPTSAGSGATITIIGTNFNSTSAITLGGTSVASFLVLSSTTVTAVVGSGATGAVSLTTAGGTASLSGFVYISSAPAINSLSIVTCSGSSFTLTPVNGVNGSIPSGTTYSWSLPSFTGTVTGGLSASDQTAIHGTLINLTSVPQTATYTVTPTSPSGQGNPFSVVVTLLPTPIINNITTVTCSGISLHLTPTDSSNGLIPINTLYSWTTPTFSTVSMTGGISGVNQPNIHGILLNNQTNTTQTATYTITPRTGSCVGAAFSLAVTVHPTPIIPFQMMINCSGTLIQLTPVITASGILPANTRYSWDIPSVSSISVTGGVSRTNQNFFSYRLFNSTNTIQSATYLITPQTTNGCTGNSFSITVTLHLKPQISPLTTGTCSGITFTLNPADGINGIVPPETKYSWSIPSATGTMTGAQSGSNLSSIFGRLFNQTQSSQTVTYQVIPSTNFCGSGSAFTVTVSVNIAPSISPMSLVTENSTPFVLNPTEPTNGIIPNATRYSWNVPSYTGSISGGQSATNQLSIAGLLFNPSVSPQTATYTITPIAPQGCVGTPFTLTVTVSPNPPPTIISFTPTSAKSGDTITITGTNLTGTSAITLGGAPVASFQVLSSTTITAVVGSGETGAVSLTTNGGLAVLFGFTFITPPPEIISFSPQNGPVGTLVTISGKHLQSFTSIKIGGVPAIPISFSGSTLVAMVMPGATNGSVSINTSGGTVNSTDNYIVTNSKIPNIQQGNKLVGNGATGNSYQGERVALSADGNTAIIGGSYDDGFKGAAWIYTRSGSTWTQQGNKLVGTGSSSISFQGSGVAISADGNTAIVGGYADNSNKGAAWIFTRNGNSWTQQGPKLVGTGAVGSAQQGYSVAISADGNTAIIGGWADDSNKGAVWIFTRNGSTWSQMENKLVGSGAIGNPQQGFSVAISADAATVIIGGNGDNSNKGAAWVFTRFGNSWTQQGNKLVGNDLAGNPFLGASVAVSADGNTAILGGFKDSTQGAAWVFVRTGNNWTQQGSKLVATGSVGFTNQGIGVTLSADGNTAMIGDRIDTSNLGGAWIYTRSGGTWTQRGSKIAGTGAVGRPAQQGVGVSISADGNTAMIGGPGDDNTKGAAWIFTTSPSPTIISFTPTAASTGAVITITGSNLIGTSAITLGGTSVASFTVVSPNTINATVGFGSTGALSLVTPEGSASLSGFIFISPAPSVNSLSTVTCSGTSFSLSPVNGINGKIPDGTIYSWSVPSLNAGLSGGVSSSNQTFISGTLLNSSGKVQTAVYTVVPSHPTFGNGVPFTVTIFVQPELVITPLSITGCGKMIFKTIPLTNTSGPVSDSSLHIWTTPNQTVSFITRVRPQNNFYSVDSVNWINEFNFNKRFYYFPNPSGSCFGPNYRLDVYLNPVPSINAMTSTSCSGLPFVLSPSNGANGIVPDSISFSWNVPLLSASLTGGTSGANLSAITGQFFNSSNVTQTATYSITPLSTNGNCPGDPFTLTVSVNPTPAITPMTITACRRVTFTAVAFNGTNGLVPTNTRYTWGIPTQTASIVGGRSGVNQPFLVDTLANESNRLQEAYYTLTPSAGNCVGKNFTLTVSINPVPVIKEIISEVCSGATFLVSPTNGTDGIVPSGVRYVWNAPTVTSGITGGQSNNAPPNIFGTLRNTTDTTQTATYYVSPLGTTCGFGPVFTLTVSVLPTPSIQNLSITTNSGVPFAITPVNLIDGIVPTGTLYSWNVPTFNGTATGGQAGTNRSSIQGTLQNTSAVLQSATYIVTPATGNCNGLSFTVSVNINPQLIIQSFNPISAGKGLTVTIRGKGFASVNRVSFGGTVALSYTIVSDTTMNAVVGDGNSGFVKIESAYVKDSLAGFTWGSPVIQIGTPDSISVFGAERGKFSPTQSYLVSGQFLQSSLIINAPDSFQISRSVTGSFVKTISIEPINGTIDTSRIFVRFKSDAPGVFSGIISHSSTAAINKSLSVTGNANCDSVVYLTPVINNIKTDTVICFKDSVTLNVSNGTFSKYFWSNGDSTNKLVIKNSGTFNVKVSSGNGCISYQSLNIRTNKNTNTTPSLALVGNRLISTSAPRYRWLFNNNYVPGNTSNGIVPNKVGLYAVETSNDSICWDRSLDYPIIVLSTPLVNDTLNVKIFPNPTSTGTFFVVASLKKVTNVVVRVTVSDANGNILTQTNPFIFFGREIKIPISLTFKGTAFVRTDVNGDIVTQTVILQ
jgi:hypothetical protein